MMEERGCDKDSPIPGYWRFDNLEWNRCPMKIVTQESILFLQAFTFYKEGFFPSAGGWKEQSCKLLEAFLVIESELRKIQKTKERKQHEFQ